MIYLAAFLLVAQASTDFEVRVGSKVFTESVILGDIATQMIRAEAGNAVHRRELGGTQILFHALQADELDVYPEYTGTITGEIFSSERVVEWPRRPPIDDEKIRRLLSPKGLAMSRPLGFNNSYAIGMRWEVAAKLGIKKLSDLALHPELKFGFGNEFMERRDGWPGVRDHYGLPQVDVRGLDHDLAYRALEAGEIDATELYSTDAEIKAQGILVLVDDKNFYPQYQCVWVYRQDLERRSPRAFAVLKRLEGQIDEATMIAMNARAKFDRVPEERVAADFLASRFGIKAEVASNSRMSRILSRLVEHLGLVSVSLTLAILAAIPLGIVAAKRPKIGAWILGATSVIQTIPSLALLVFMIPWLGIGAKPALVALFLYSLLPIVRSTATGLLEIPPSLRESAQALGLPARARLRLVELPMATRGILSGIKTAAVINVGTATIGALIGAGGFGQPILTGIRRDDLGQILFEGAIPSAILALAVQAGFDLAERWLVPRGMKG